MVSSVIEEACKEHVSKFNSKSVKVRTESAFYKHLLNTHSGKADDKEFQILKSYKKPFTRLVEEGTFIASHNGELLNSKSEWHQAKVVRTTTQVIQGGADFVRSQQIGGRGGREGGGRDGVDPNRGTDGAEGQQPLGRRNGGRSQRQ